MGVHDGHRGRLKERFAKTGFDGFHEHEILELILCYSIPNGDINPLAHRLIKSFGSISGVFEAHYDELIKIDGVGPHTASLLKMIPQITRVYMEDKYTQGTVLETTEQLIDFMKYKYIGRPNEVVYILCFDGKRKLIYSGIIHEGTINASLIETRTVVELALRHNATSVAISHNHPNGFAIPSTEDLNATRFIMKALKFLSIEFIDHIIVTNDDQVSMKMCGVLYDEW